MIVSNNSVEPVEHGTKLFCDNAKFSTISRQTLNMISGEANYASVNFLYGLQQLYTNSKMCSYDDK